MTFKHYSKGWKRPVGEGEISLHNSSHRTCITSIKPADNTGTGAPADVVPSEIRDFGWIIAD